jgi:hypothetical protein
MSIDKKEKQTMPTIHNGEGQKPMTSFPSKPLPTKKAPLIINKPPQQDKKSENILTNEISEKKEIKEIPKKNVLINKISEEKEEIKAILKKNDKKIKELLKKIKELQTELKQKEKIRDEVKEFMDTHEEEMRIYRDFSTLTTKLEV